jgi:DNA replication protein DnaC
MQTKEPEQKKTGLGEAYESADQFLSRAATLRTSSINLTIGNECAFHHRELVDGKCDVCEDLVAMKRDSKTKAEAARIENLLGGIRLGARYRGKTFADYIPTCPEAQTIKNKCVGFARTFEDRLAAGDNLLMLGNYGTGKNALAAAICQEIAGAGYSSVHTTVLKMLRRIKSTWNKNNDEDEQTVIDAFIIPDLLVVDEIGVQFGSDTEKLLIFEALNGRYEEKKPTILISNLTDMRELSDYLGERVMDRMREGSTGILKFGWKSYRGAAQ